MQKCRCQRMPGSGMNVLRLVCMECEGHAVRCQACGQEIWWTDQERLLALNAAESHRWETGHSRVLVGDSMGIVLREVLGKLSAA
jgi:hypothetical protein